MKILLVHNDYGKISGEEVVVDNLHRLLSRHGHEVRQFRHLGIGADIISVSAAKAFASGIYNPFSRRKLRELLKGFRPDLVHVHNVYPLISPSVLDEAASWRLPVVMTLHNYRLLCPSGGLLSHGKICARCTTGVREVNCVLRNCERSLLKSFGYATRNAVARIRQSFTSKVQHFIALSDFQKGLHQKVGIENSRISVIPNMIEEWDTGNEPATQGAYVGYVGRISPEKGVHVIVQAARRLPHIPFLFAGDFARMPGLVRDAPANCTFLGPISRESELSQFYDRARFLVSGSIWYEVCPLSCLEAMMRGRALVGPEIGGMPEIIRNRQNGLLYSVGSDKELAAAVQYLWVHRSVAEAMGAAGRKIWKEKHSSAPHYAATMNVYDRVTNANVAIQ